MLTRTGVVRLQGGGIAPLMTFYRTINSAWNCSSFVSTGELGHIICKYGFPTAGCDIAFVILNGQDCDIALIISTNVLSFFFLSLDKTDAPSLVYANFYANKILIQVHKQPDATFVSRPTISSLRM